MKESRSSQASHVVQVQVRYALHHRTCAKDPLFVEQSCPTLVAGSEKLWEERTVPFVRELPEVWPACFSTQLWLLVLPGFVQFLALLGSEER